MKFKLIIALLIPFTALAQDPFITRTGSEASGCMSGIRCSASVNSRGNIFVVPVNSAGTSLDVIPVSNATGLNGSGAASVVGAYIVADTAETGSTTTVINATSHVAKVGDYIRFNTAAAPSNEWSVVSAITTNTITVNNAFTTAPLNGNSFNIRRPSIEAANELGASFINIDSSWQTAAATGILKNEDAPADNAGAGVFIFQHANDGLASRCSSGDYCPFSGDNRGVQWITNTGNAAGGSTTYSKISTADNNSTNVKASAGSVYSIHASNLNAAVRYIKLYNKATAPTCGTDTPVIRMAIPPASAGAPPITFPTGASFPLGIGICIVTGITDADNTATAASEQLVNITYN